MRNIETGCRSVSKNRKPLFLMHLLCMAFLNQIKEVSTLVCCSKSMRISKDRVLILFLAGVRDAQAHIPNSSENLSHQRLLNNESDTRFGCIFSLIDCFSQFLRIYFL